MAQPWLQRLQQTYCVQGAAPPELAPQLALEIELQCALLQVRQGQRDAGVTALARLQEQALQAGAGLLALSARLERVELLCSSAPGQARRLLREGLGLAAAGCLQPFLRLLARQPELLDELPATLRHRLGAPLPGAAGEPEALSAREQAVLELIAQGLSNQQISERLFISLATVKTHARHIHAKLGVERRTQAVARAKQLGWLV